MTQKISVFGSANLKLAPEVFHLSYQMGQLLGQAGMTVMTGGYTGTMAAVSQGAFEAGGAVIGVTSDEIEAFRPIGPNQWITEEWRCQTFKERLDRLVEECDAAIALPGGLGTLTEISLTWNNLVIHTLPPKPLILVGAGWQETLEAFWAAMAPYVSEPSRAFLSFASDEKDAMAILHEQGIF